VFLCHVRSGIYKASFLYYNSSLVSSLQCFTDERRSCLWSVAVQCKANKQQTHLTVLPPGQPGSAGTTSVEPSPLSVHVFTVSRLNAFYLMSQTAFYPVALVPTCPCHLNLFCRNMDIINWCTVLIGHCITWLLSSNVWYKTGIRVYQNTSHMLSE